MKSHTGESSRPFHKSRRGKENKTHCFYLTEELLLFTMLISKKNRREVYKYLFKEGVLYAEKDFNLPNHPEIEGVPNLEVIKLMQSFKSRELVSERYAWRHYYWFLTDAGIEYLREYLCLPEEIVPATLKKSALPLERNTRPPRGDRPRRFDDGPRGGYRSEKAGAPGEYRPEFRGGFGRGSAQ